MAWFNRRPKTPTAELEKRSSIDTWLQDYLVPYNEYGWGQFSYGGQTYPWGLTQTYGTQRAQEWSPTLPGYMAAVRRCPPAFAAQMVRAQVLSQARFTFRRRYLTNQGTPGTFGSRELDVLHKPWPNGTAGELIARMEWDVGLAGNAYVTNWSAGRLRVLRPDWVMIVYGSQREPDYPAQALDSQLLGYVYQNGGINSGVDTPEFISPVDMAHWSPLPDPLNAGLGMSWITPAIREIQGDTLATEHKIKFFENGATPNMVVKGVQAGSREEFLELVDQMEDSHAGIRNAYKTLYLTQGADATVVGANLQEIDFSQTIGGGETRIAMLSRVHPVILGMSEGLKGSSLNAGNFGMARRIWADTWIYPTLQDLCAALAKFVTPPPGPSADLWFDPSDMPILREDASDAANIMSVEAATVANLVKEGFTPDSAVASVRARDVALLRHSGLMSVQLQPPGAGTTPGASAPNGAGGGGLVSAPVTGPLSGGGTAANDRAMSEPTIGNWAHLPSNEAYVRWQIESGQWTPEEFKSFDPDAMDADWDELSRSIGEAMHPGATAKLMAYWSHGEGAAKIGWGAPGDFERCRTNLGKYVQRPDELAGLCANLHHMALGVWPGQEHGHKGGKG